MNVRFGTLCMYNTFSSQDDDDEHDDECTRCSQSHLHRLIPLPCPQESILFTTYLGLKKTGPKTVAQSSCDIICGCMEIRKWHH